jgi:RNA polymerase sigma factor (sigma-70 family)
MIAAKNYRSDHKSNASFCSFAVTVIENKMIRSIRSNRFIHLPEHYLKCRYDLKKLNEKYKGKITDDIIKKELGISEEMLSVLKEDVNKNAIFLEDMFLCEDGDNRDWNDFLEDSKNISPFEKASGESLRGYLNEYMKKLSITERQVICEKHFSDSLESFCEIAMRLDISKERVRQIYMAALRKLKRHMAEDWEAKNGKLEAENKSNYSNCIMPQVFNENKKQDRCDKVFEQLLWGG